MTDSGKAEMLPEEPGRGSRADLEGAQYLDHSFDLVALVRASRERAQRQIDEFGNAAEYEITQIFGKRSDLVYAELPEAGEADPRRDHPGNPEVASEQLRAQKRRKKEGKQPSFEFESRQVKREEPELNRSSLGPSADAPEPRIKKA
jgi:hypothetical protein